MAIDYTKAEMRLVPTVEFQYGSSPTKNFYIRSGEDTVIGSDTYVAVPQLDIRMTKMVDGGVKDYPFEVTMPAKFEPMASMIVEPHSSVEVIIGEVDLDTLSTGIRTVFRGKISITKSRPKGKSKIVTGTIAGRKQRLEGVSLGIMASPRCVWGFTSLKCGIVKATVQETGTITVINGPKVTVTGLSFTATSTYYMRGWIEFDDLSIMIRKHGATNVFNLAYPPPAGWLNQTVVVVPGCLKRPEDCDAKWSNAARFMGIGLKMPNYHPIIEDKP